MSDFRSHFSLKGHEMNQLFDAIIGLTIIAGIALAALPFALVIDWLQRERK